MLHIYLAFLIVIIILVLYQNRINFLSIEEAMAVFNKYSICNVSNCLGEHNPMEFTADEKLKIATRYYLNPAIDSFGPLNLIKIKDDFGFIRWFTMGENYIAIPAEEINISAVEFTNTMNHEIEHLRQRKYKAAYQKIYDKLGIIAVNKNEIKTDLNIVDNPDDPYNSYHLYKYGDKYIYTGMILAGDKTVFVAALIKDNTMIKYWRLADTPADIIDNLVARWRLIYPDYDSKKLIENGYSPNEIMAYQREYGIKLIF